MSICEDDEDCDPGQTCEEGYPDFCWASGVAASACSDTDPTQDPSIAGTVISNWGGGSETRDFSDRCGTGSHSNELTQYWCLPEGGQGAAGKTILCPSGCSDGECVAP